MDRTLRRPLLQVGAALLALMLLFSVLPNISAQDDVRYFTETGHSLRGVFRNFWEANGGVNNFGYPISEEYLGSNGLTTQWFERARFELVTLNGQYQVVLGNLGAEIIGSRVFPKVPPIENTADRRYIAETQHIIQYGFKEIWETRGDVRIFGYPLSEEIDELFDDGSWHTVQYFERARFEYWPNYPPGQRVILSTLGRKLAPSSYTSTTPGPGVTPGTTATPTAAPIPTAVPAQPLPPNVNASVSPESGPPGTTFNFEAKGFEPNEEVGIWLTLPNQTTSSTTFRATADNAGSIAAAKIAVTSDASYANGIWSFNAQGVNSGKQAIGYFRITSVSIPGDSSRIGVMVHDQLPTQGNATIAPIAAPAGTNFHMVGGGFTKDEAVSAWITAPNGNSIPIDSSYLTVEGTSAKVTIPTVGLSDGIYTAVLFGQTSKVSVVASFKLTRDYVAGPGSPRPANVNGSATPVEGGAGTTFQIRGWGFNPNEKLQVWMTEPTGLYTLVTEPRYADANGKIGYEPVMNIITSGDAVPGVYGVHFYNKATGARSDVYFTVLGR